MKHFHNQKLLTHFSALTLNSPSITLGVSTEATLQSVWVFVQAVILSYFKKQLLWTSEDCNSKQNSWGGRGSGASDAEWNKDDASDMWYCLLVFHACRSYRLQIHFQLRVCCTTVPITVSPSADSHGGFTADVYTHQKGKKKKDQTNPNFDQIIIYFILIKRLLCQGWLEGQKGCGLLLRSHSGWQPRSGLFYYVSHSYY